MAMNNDSRGWNLNARMTASHVEVDWCMRACPKNDSTAQDVYHWKIDAERNVQTHHAAWTNR